MFIILIIESGKLIEYYCPFSINTKKDIKIVKQKMRQFSTSNNNESQIKAQ